MVRKTVRLGVQKKRVRVKSPPSPPSADSAGRRNTLPCILSSKAITRARAKPNCNSLLMNNRTSTPAPLHVERGVGRGETLSHSRFYFFSVLFTNVIDRTFSNFLLFLIGSNTFIGYCHVGRAIDILLVIWIRTKKIASDIFVCSHYTIFINNKRFCRRLTIFNPVN